MQLAFLLKAGQHFSQEACIWTPASLSLQVFDTDPQSRRINAKPHTPVFKPLPGLCMSFVFGSVPYFGRVYPKKGRTSRVQVGFNPEMPNAKP